MRSSLGMWTLLALLGGTLSAVRIAAATDTDLAFVRDGATVKTLDRAALERGCQAATVTIDDPYYGRAMRYRACPLAEVLALGFGALEGTSPDGDVFFRARDGYVKPASVARAREAGGWLAFADADRMRGDDPGFAPIDRRQVDPAPYYVVWEHPAQRDTHRYPWPYQLAAIELASFASRYPHTEPTGLPPEAAAWKGYAIFRGECSACHAINGEGGTIGPELNVPQSIVEYRPAAQLKAFIRKPESFRYTSMPSHEHLSDADLDALIAYFGAMRARKHDPKRGATAAVRAGAK